MAGLVFGYGCKKKDTTTTPPLNTPTVLTVKEENKALLLDFSETWCPPCGSYAVPSFDKIVTDLENTTVCCVSIASSSTPADFNSKYSSAMGTDWALKGVPSFFVNEDPLSPTGGVYSDPSQNMTWVQSKANNFSGSAVNAAVALDKKIDGTTLTIRTKTKFFADYVAGTDYRLALYVVEDKVLADQATTTGTLPMLAHSNLLRGGPTATYKGDALNAKGAIALGQQYEKEYTYTLNAAWKTSDIKVVAVIWEVPASGKPKVVNCNMVK